VSIQAEGNTVTYTFDACTGPWGLVTVSGSETVVFSPGPTADSFEVSFASDGLEVNGDAAEHTGTAIITLLSDRRTIDFTGEYEGNALLGPRKVHHEIDFALELFDTGAFTIDGSSSTTVGLRGLELDVQDLQRPGPKGTCLSGVVVAKRKLSALEITLTFDGSPELLVESSRGGHETFALECEAES